MNKIHICGRLTRDPETRTGNGTQVTRYTVAVDRKFKRDGQPEADFFNCTAFGKGAEFADKYLRQGTMVIVTGRMESDNYTNKDGQKVYAWQLVVEEQEFAESKKASQDRDDTTNAEKFIASQVVPAERYVDIPDGIEEDLPFI